MLGLAAQAVHEGRVVNGQLCFASGQTAGWPVDEFVDLGISLESGKTYEVAFDVEWVSDDMTIGLLDFRTGAIQGDTPGVMFVWEDVIEPGAHSGQAVAPRDFQLGFWMRLDYTDDADGTVCVDNIQVNEVP